MGSLVEKVGRIEKRLNGNYFAHEEVADPAEQRAVLAGYASRLRQQRYATSRLYLPPPCPPPSPAHSV